ncbi:PHP domain-containing protein [Ureibacillus manganicus]|uniref:Phosphoesterase n=1 Tax=Ureibacillus manganicus DSM 26584 TaxID=1384049 RepID=A0A0A3I3H7_9BACL|nr:PHP domain-containing protein [Ureibacillus manganicus]KGR79336.1 phosphoesterase [Ureibacillus manganicus DSM 26584]
MKLDLHLHSTFSDGADTLEVLFEMAKKKGLTHISIVDHDTTRHVQPAKLLAEEYDIRFIPGIEISAYDFKRNRKVHILGYDFRDETPHIDAICTQLLDRRHQHSLWQLEKIQQAGLNLQLESAMSYVTDGGILYKQHIMNALTDAPFNSVVYQTLYRNLFKGDGVAKGDITYVDAFKAVEAIRADGGYAVLAHPGQLDSFDIAEELVPVGLGGIEKIHPDHTLGQVNRIVNIANTYELFTTGGSDYHGRYGAVSVTDEYSLQNVKNIPFIK